MLEAAKAYAFVRHGGAHRDRDYRPVMSAFTVMLLVVLFSVLAPSVAHGIHATGDLDCDQCHKPHVPAVGTGLLDVDDPSVENATDVCMFCHDSINTGGSTIKVEGEFGLTSGHVVESDTTPDLTNECSGCHSPHTDTTGLPRPELNGYTVDTATHPNTWCRACHDPDSDPTPGDLTKPDSNWSGVTGTDYYDQMFTSRLPDTYIGSGTFRGWTAYDASAHGLLTPATADLAAGDCLWCHERHSSTSTYDNLKGDFGPSTPTDINADACFASGCHDDYATMGYGSGHFITDAADASPMDPDAPLPCYECHNAHGSKNGNTKLIQDSLGAGLDPSTKAGESAFCYTCHLSSDGYGWNSTTTGMELWTTLASESGITTSVAGIPREDMLVLPPTVPQHAYDNLAGCGCHGSVHAPNPEGVSNGGQKCYDCHGDYAPKMESGGSAAADWYHHVLGVGGATPVSGDFEFTSTSYPGAGTDVFCLSCHVDHDKFNASKSANLRAAIGAAPGTASGSDTDFPSDGTNEGVCIGCHKVALDKDLTNQEPGTGATAATGQSAKTPAITRTDYEDRAHDYWATSTFEDTTTFRANCVKCHNDEEAQKTGTSYSGYQISGASIPPYKFGIHWSAESRLAMALEAAIVTGGISTEENLCFKCHDGTYNAVAADPDGYGVYPPDDGDMSDASQAVKNYFTSSTYANVTVPWAVKRHAVVTYVGDHRWDETQTYLSTNKHVECEDCHNPHAAGNTPHAAGGTADTAPGTADGDGNGNMINTDSPLRGATGIDVGTWPTWASPSSGTYSADATADYEFEVCFKCHSLANTNVTTWGGSGATAWTNVALEFNTSNRSYHPVVGATANGTAKLGRMKSPWTASGQTMACSDCHGGLASDPGASGPHGSSVPHILIGYWPTNTSNAALNVSGNAEYAYYLSGSYSGLLCAECHNFDSTQVPAHNAAAHRDTSEGKCYFCHIVVPHGGGLDGLIGDGGGTALEGGSTMPSRYAYNGDKANMKMWGYNQMITGASARNACDASGCGNHKNTAVPDW